MDRPPARVVSHVVHKNENDGNSMPELRYFLPTSYPSSYSGLRTITEGGERGGGKLLFTVEWSAAFAVFWLCFVSGAI